MKTVEMYQCEYCNETYKSKEEAIRCEAYGKQPQLVQEGQMIEYKVVVGGGFDPFFVEMRVRKVTDYGHIYHYEFEQYDEETNEWYENTYRSGGIYGNDDFKKHCTLLT